MIKKQNISHFFRTIGLAKAADTGRFYVSFLKNYLKNKRFSKLHPSEPIPPAYLMYESFQMNAERYFVAGREDAEEIVEAVRPYCKLNDISVLDWGCGPGRIIRHMPSIIGDSNKYFGTDYNRRTIEWCQKNLKGFEFIHNEVTPPLKFPFNHFGLIYGISILTHLSEENQLLWSKELERIVSHEGIVYLTTHGEAFKEILTEAERELFENNKLVSRTNVKEGHRMYGAFHPPMYIKNVFENAGLEVIKHIPGKRVHESYIAQDIWLLKKKQG